MLRLAWRLLLDQPSKSLGTLFGVVVSTFLMAQQMSTFLGILGRVTAFAAGSNVDLWIGSSTTQTTDITDSVPMTYVARVVSTPGVAHAAAQVQGMARATRPDGARELVKLVGIDPHQALGLPRTLVGTTRADFAGPSSIFMNEADRPLYGGVQRGERLEIGGHTSIVGGFFTGIEPHDSFGYMFTPLAHARTVLGIPDDRATFVVARLAEQSQAQDVAAQLRRRLPEARVFTSQELARAEIEHFLERTPVGIVFAIGTIVAGLVGMLIVGLTMFSSVVDQTRDFGTLRAIGATRRDLRVLIVGQALSFFAFGTSLGLGLFGLVKYHAADAPMLSPPPMFGLVVVFSLGSCLLASLIAVRRVLRIEPAIVFRG